MDLNFALDELHATGWSSLDSAGCAFTPDGRAYPTVSRVVQEFAAAGFNLTITAVPKFNCFRAEWRESGTSESQAVVSHSEAEAAVYALAKLRRSLVAA